MTLVDFMILNWNVEENKLTLTRADFMISSWNVEKDWLTLTLIDFMMKLKKSSILEGSFLSDKH